MLMLTIINAVANIILQDWNSAVGWLVAVFYGMIIIENKIFHDDETINKKQRRK